MFNKSHHPLTPRAAEGQCEVRARRPLVVRARELEEAADVGAHGDRIAEDRVRHEVVEAAQSASG